MLVKLTVSNFMSFEKETNLSMVSSNKIRQKPEHKVDIKNTSLLKYAAIYGANAAGKSNLVEAFKFIQYAVQKTIPAQATTMFCKLKESNAKAPSLLELQFTINNKFYAYGFSAILQERKIMQEWLYELNQNGTAKPLFTREYGEKPIVENFASFKDNDKSKLKTYLDDFDENSGMLFLTFMNKDKKYTQQSKLMFFKEVFNWIDQGIDIYTPRTLSTSFKYYYNETSLAKINELIKTFDTGISEVSIEEISQEELKKEIPAPIFDDLVMDLKDKLESSPGKVASVSMRSERSFVNISVHRNGELKITTIKMKHGNSFYDFKFKEESDGTRRLFDLLDILLNSAENKVYIIDEVERSLHPKLTERFIDLFGQMHQEKKVQLIFTTHESSIMDQELFRRDEIWFVERDTDNKSNVYSLDKFKERYDKRLSKAYLEGRYGAIPIFTTFNTKEQ